jgi:UDP-glucose 4-epimerase
VNCLVVGGAGFIGAHLVERLVAEGHAVDVVDDLSCGSLGNLADARALGGDLKINTLDATTDEFASFVGLRHPDVVYHLALLPPGHHDVATAAAAVRSMLLVLEAARLHGGTKVVFGVPAVALYGDVPARDLPVKEGVAWSPVGVRGVVARSLCDLAAVYRAEHDVEFTALALSNVYGPRQRADGGVVGAFAAALRDRVSPMIHGDGRQTRDFVYIDDAVDAFVRAGTRAGGLVVNVGSGTATSVRDLWQLMAGPDGASPSPSPRRPGDVTRFALSPTRARIHLAWAPWTELAVGLRSLRG